ncbi:MAG TPA: AMP-dependent synthetase [Candidatus Thioglobus sp.]|nr:AMP-dependent synthetase [Candidatus Thioglobus sp.]
MIVNLAHYLLDSNHQDYALAFHEGESISYNRFKQAVKQLIPGFLNVQQENIAIYYDQAYPFAVNLFALLHSNKKVWITANNTQATADKLIAQGCLLWGEWQGRELMLTDVERHNKADLAVLDINKQLFTIFTSGSSGQAKAITKSLRQFQTEIETLENYWGQQLADAQVLATVSHQHIYGLLFRVLWPLAARRCFHSDMYLSPEPLLKRAKDISTCWVASPAQLKRLDELTPWQDISALSTVFSSGGDLPLATAQQIHQHSQQKVIEVYGSSETGGIAWRQSVDNAAWTLFDKMTITISKGHIAHLVSPYLLPLGAFVLDDIIEPINQNQFILLGRKDRIVKIEEKRLSLDELEQSLNTSLWVTQSHTLVLKGTRDKIAAVTVLSDLAIEQLQLQGRSQLIKQIRQHLLNRFESVVLPRKWLFIQALPYTAQGKINQQLLTELLSLDSNRFPQIVQCDFQDNHVELQLKVLAKIVYFTGHFPEQPILPGVTQIAWAEQFGKLFFAIKQPFLRMEVIKFKKIIRPGDTISMTLNWKAESSKLYFEINSETDSHSSGRMVYGAQ